MQYLFYSYIDLLTRHYLDGPDRLLWLLDWDRMKVVERDILYYLEECGIARAWSCLECDDLGSDGDGYEYNGTWPVCDRHEEISDLSAFPFRRAPMRCRAGFVPSFWATSYSCLLDGEEANYCDAVDRWRAWFCPETA